MENKLSDLVYILGKGSRWSDNELRYSLRSVDAFAPGRRVFIVGEYPEWLKGAEHIKAEDRSKNKIENAINKYLAAINDPRVSSRFVLMNDDFFIRRETDLSITYSRGRIAEMIGRHPSKNGYYFDALVNTKRRLFGLGVEDPIDYEVHAPMEFDKELLRAAIAVSKTKNPVLMRSIYGNLNAVQAEKSIDFKAANLAELAWQIGHDMPYLSTNDGLVATDEFRRWVERTFRKPSRFEMDGGAGAKAMPGKSGASMRYYAMTPFKYEKKRYEKGDIISREDIVRMKMNKKMEYLWERK